MEIGPGEGAMTRPLAEAGVRLVAVELDRRAVEGLRAEFGNRISILAQDILTVDFRELARQAGSAIRIVGNIPYNITSPILFQILDQRESVRDATLMMQREVARRLAARPGTKDYGILSVSFGIWTEVELLFEVAPGAFRPPPMVFSTVVRLRTLAVPRAPVRDEMFFRGMVRAVFGQRRKMLRNTLQSFIGKTGLALPGEFALKERPEELSPEELVDLANRLQAVVQG